MLLPFGPSWHHFALIGILFAVFLSKPPDGAGLNVINRAVDHRFSDFRVSRELSLQPGNRMLHVQNTGLFQDALLPNGFQNIIGDVLDKIVSSSGKEQLLPPRIPYVPAQ